MIDGIGLKLLLSALAMFIAASAVLTGREYFAAPIQRIIGKCRKMRWPAVFFNVALCTLLISAAIQAGGTKTNGVMNLPPQTMAMQRPGLARLRPDGISQLQTMTAPGAPMEQTVADEEIAQGYRLVTETNDAAYSYAMPSNAQIVGNWHKRGTFGEWMPVQLGMDFPLGANMYSSFSVFSDGKIRPRPRDIEHQITAVGVPMLFMQGASMFWTSDCDDGSMLLTWGNAFLDAGTNAPVNAQMRLYPNGDFTTRSNDLLRVFRRINPEDWDGDGLANNIDAEPKASNGHCFGTGVDWLNANCHGVLAAYAGGTGEIEVVWDDGANPGAYYWLTFTSLADGNLVAITCDGPSNLGDLTVIANSNQVCRVPLLVGASYHVVADGLLAEVSASDMNAAIEYDDACQAAPNHNGSALAGGQPQDGTTSSFNVSYCLCISFTADGTGFWTLGATPKNPGLVLDEISGFCCSAETSTNGFAWICSDCCTCGAAGHQLAASVSWEGYSKVYWCETQCGCACDAPPPEPQDGPFAASVSVSFDKDAIIFEDAYENLPGVWVERRSTAARLTIRANGGPNGGVLTVSALNLDKLQKNSGPAFPSTPVAVPAGRSIAYEMNYVGLVESNAENDICVTAILEHDDLCVACTNECRLTSVRLALSPVWEAPENPCANRHMYGVGEKVLFNVFPKLQTVVISTTKLDSEDDDSGYELFDGVETTDASAIRTYMCPISKNYEPSIRVRHGEAEYEPSMLIVEPEMVVAEGAAWGENAVDVFYQGNRMCWPLGCVGEATLVTTNYIGPMSVSFRGIAVSELPCYEEDVVTGCFTNGHWRTHTTGAGAGKAYYVSTNNFWFVDAAGSRTFESHWVSGSTLVWQIPVGWHRKSSDYTDWHGVSGPDYELRWNAQSRPLRMETVYRQIRHIDSEGTFHTEKFGHQLQRSRMCRVILDGKTIQWSHPQ